MAKPSTARPTEFMIRNSAYRLVDGTLRCTRTEKAMPLEAAVKCLAGIDRRLAARYARTHEQYQVLNSLVHAYHAWRDRQQQTGVLDPDKLSIECYFAGRKSLRTPILD